MPIRRLLEGTAFGPEEVVVITAAFGEVLRELGIARGSDATREEHVTSTIIAIAKRGEIAQEPIVAQALQALAR
jgi:hypothetical protein